MEYMPEVSSEELSKPEGEPERLRRLASMLEELADSTIRISAKMLRKLAQDREMRRRALSGSKEAVDPIALYIYGLVLQGYADVLRNLAEESSAAQAGGG